jgi:hypothetical protein
MASGHMNRVKRPDTWLHRPMLRNVKKVLANPEPSTHDPKRSSATTPASRACISASYSVQRQNRWSMQQLDSPRNRDVVSNGP